MAISNLSFRHATEGSNEESAFDFATLTSTTWGQPWKRRGCPMSRIFCETWGFRRKHPKKAPPHPNPPFASTAISNLSFRHATEGSNEESAFDFAALTLPNIGTTTEGAPCLASFARRGDFAESSPTKGATPSKPSFGFDGHFEFVIPTRDRREQRGICF